MTELPRFETDGALDGFVLGPMIGSGGHGRVFRATHGGRTGPLETVAMKVARTTELGRRERACLSRFDHPNIARLVGASGAAIATEYAAAGTLDSILAERRYLPPSEVAGLVRSVAAALEHIHDQGWIHGDVDPSNIGVRGDGSVILVDFAAARIADGSPLDESISRFVGPLRHATVAVDIRALAATARRALVPPAAFGSTPASKSLTDELARLVIAIDNGMVVSLDEVQGVFDHVTPAPVVPASTPPATGRGSTAPFGPRPTSLPAVDHEDHRHRRVPVIVGTGSVVGIVIGSAIGMSVWLAPLGLRPQAGAPRNDDVASTMTADASLVRHGLEWDHGYGLLSRVEDEELRWTVGRPGDVAAIGDWDCDGDETLGIYRPSTSEWFAFSSWESGAPSMPPRTIGAGSHLIVERTTDGCDSPRAALRSG